MSQKQQVHSDRWVKKAESVLLNRTIVQVRYATDQEMEDCGHYKRGLIIQLDDDTLFWPSSDDEGNDAGAIHYQKGDEETILPVM